jgi:hypothetical protein
MELKPLKDWTIGEVAKACSDSECNHCALFADGGCIFGDDEIPEYWDEEYIPHIMTFTPQEIEDAKTLQRMFPNIKTISRTYGGILAIDSPVSSMLCGFELAPQMFPGIAHGETFKLSDIVRCDDEQ